MLARAKRYVRSRMSYGLSLMPDQMAIGSPSETTRQVPDRADDIEETCTRTVVQDRSLCYGCFSLLPSPFSLLPSPFSLLPSPLTAPETTKARAPRSALARVVRTARLFRNE